MVIVIPREEGGLVDNLEDREMGAGLEVDQVMGMGEGRYLPLSARSGDKELSHLDGSEPDCPSGLVACTIR